jgi:ACS family hexuronate transporter-like MFS transporter
MSFRIPHLRYVIAAMLLLATMINYTDRLALAVVSPYARGELGITEQDYGQILSCFMAAYAIMYGVSGTIVDRLGVRRSYALFVVFWSVAAMGHALVRGKWTLALWRFLLGMGEPGNYPAAAKAVSEWFPAEQRALGVGIFNAGASLGSAVAPPMVVFLTMQFGWRLAFVFTGSLGLVWLLAWLVIYYPPALSPHITERERECLRDRVKPPDTRPPSLKREWLRVLRTRDCYTLAIARFLTDPVSYFVIFWLPEYLSKERHFDLRMIGIYAWIPFIFGDIGHVLGGWVSGHLMRRGWPMLRARRAVLGAAAAVMPPLIAAPLADGAHTAIALVSLATFGHALWMSNLQTLPTDLFPGWRVATAAGLAGMGGAIGGIFSNLATGAIVQQFSYQWVFFVAGLMHPLAFLLVAFSILRKPELESELRTGILQ